MIVRWLDDRVDTERHRHAGIWEIRRLLLAKDGMRFSTHDTTVRPGTETTMW